MTKKLLEFILLVTGVVLTGYVAVETKFVHAFTTEQSIVIDNTDRAVNWDNVKEALLLLKETDEKDIYGLCLFVKGTNDINLSSCKLNLDRPIKNADVEHIVPASLLPAKQCNIDKNKRDACSSDSLYKEAYHNLHNLYYAQANLNRSKGDKLYCAEALGISQPSGFIAGKDCITPPVESRGIVARATLYMVETYKISVDDKYMRLMNSWNKRYRVTDSERKRAMAVDKMQPSIKCNKYVLPGCSTG